MKTTEAPKIITFDCNAAQQMLDWLLPKPEDRTCPGCEKEVTPCQLGGLFNGKAYHSALPCLLVISDYLTGTEHPLQK